MSLNKLCVVLMTLAPAARAEKLTRAQYVMGTVLEITADGAAAEAAATEAFAEVVRWDRLLSLYKKDSELSRLNAAAAEAPFACSPDVYRAIEAAVAASRATGGLFNPALLPALRGGKEKLPLTDLADVVLDPKTRTVSFKKDGMGLTLDAFAKGYALDRAAELIRARKVSALLNFGGQLLAVGTWAVVVPGRPDELLLQDASASTSGNSEQPGHIVDPRTGERALERPAVTVVAKTGAEADAWSTALFVAGPNPPSGRCAIFEGRAELPPACRRLVQVKKQGAAKS